MDYQEDNLFPPLKKGKTLSGKYEIIEVIANSNYGRVYKGTDKVHQYKICAIKEIYYKTGEFTPEITAARENFNRDISFLSTISHPSIPEIIDHFSDGLRHYLIMEYIEGRSLHEKYRTETRLWPQEEIIAFSISISAILECFHRRNFFFHNFHPEHIIINREGKIKLVSFSMTGHFRAKTIQTPYVAPEEYKKGEIIDKRTDIYSLGVLMYYLATGNEPEQSHPFNFSRVKEINYSISDKFINIISKCTSFSKENRYDEISELLKALESFSIPENYKKLFPVENPANFFPPAVISPGQVKKKDEVTALTKDTKYNIPAVCSNSKVAINKLSEDSFFIEASGRGMGDMGNIIGMSFWLTFWTIGGLVAIATVIHTKQFFLFLWLIMWAIGEYAGSNILISDLTVMFGKVTFLFTNKELKIETYWGGIIPLETTYPIAQIEDFKITTTDLNTPKSGIPRAVSMKHSGGKILNLPVNISIEDNRHLCKELNKITGILKRGI